MDRIGVVLLAAGGSTRMGTPKQLLPIWGKSLLRHAAEVVAATGFRPAVAVLGADLGRMMMELDGLPISATANPDWERGIGTSIRVGVNAALAADQGLDAVVVTLADLPAVTTELLGELVGLYRDSKHPVVACRYGETAGVPALFARPYFADLMGLPDDQGAKRLIAAAGPGIALIDFPGGAADIDTPADYERLRERGPGS